MPQSSINCLLSTVSKLFLLTVDARRSCRNPNQQGEDWVTNLGYKMSWSRHFEERRKEIGAACRDFVVQAFKVLSKLDVRWLFAALHVT
jgi:hypothetical protein